MPGSLASLLEEPAPRIHSLEWPAYLPTALTSLLLPAVYDGQPHITATAIKNFEAVGRYLHRHPRRPLSFPLAQKFIRTDFYYAGLFLASLTKERDGAPQAPPRLDPIPYLGAAVTLCAFVEQSVLTVMGPSFEDLLRNLGPLEAMVRYVKCRVEEKPSSALPDLAVPAEFKQAFRSWAKKEATFCSNASDGLRG